MKKTLFTKLCTLILAAGFVFLLYGCEEDKGTETSDSISTVSQQNVGDSDLSSGQEVSTESNANEASHPASSGNGAGSSAADGTSNSGSGTAQSSVSGSSQTQSAMEIAIWNQHASPNIKAFVEWINSGGDSNEENAAFLEAARKEKRLLVPVPKKDELKEYSVDVNRYRSGYSYYWIIGKEDLNTSQLFQVSIRLITEKTKNYSLDNYYFAYAENKGQAIKSGTWKGIEYHYTDYAENEKGEQISDTRFWFEYEGNMVFISTYHSLRYKPFTPEYLDYFDYEFVKLNIKG